MCGMVPNLRLRCHVGGTLDHGILSSRLDGPQPRCRRPSGVSPQTQGISFVPSQLGFGKSVLEPSVPSTSICCTRVTFALYCLSVCNMQRKSACKRFRRPPLMNPINNCKVKQQMDLCKYDELSFRFFFPQRTPPKKNPFKLKDSRIKNFQPNGQENHESLPKSVHFEYF
ncbi:unnamed protein product [Rangifer tarandus platyrhynchus]|uniref:Uncharacterized protein n=2 Tax=Rangifer tarandus platyrhynchus TaxID=3082113 RepID=A0ABN8ZDD0_RANTA|nr:unnamed protein product [Rangifer tarandus platyrhynchus]